MMRVKIPYYWVDRWGNGYWTPKKHMRDAGFGNVACGPDGPEAHAKAMAWVQRWRDFQAGKITAVETWPEGSVGEGFQRFRDTGEWQRKAPRTREDWERGWVYIKPIFGDRAPSDLTLEDLSLWYNGDPNDPSVKGLVDRAGIREAHRAVKVWRALWQVIASLQYCHPDRDPSFGIRRITPKGRSARWSEGETVRLVKRAIRMNYHGAACIIAICWDTQFSPVDARTLRARHLIRQKAGVVFDRTEEGRTKSEAGVLGTLSPRSQRLVLRYIEATFGSAELHPDAFLFRTRTGDPYSKNVLGKDFRVIRIAEFGTSETRQLQDMRRSAAIEAVAGEVDPSALAKKMGNTIDESRELQNTYLPAVTEVVRIADQARLVGRRRLRGQK
jgi:hypothetical protein